MLIVMKSDATDAQVAHVCDVITELGFKPHAMPGATRTAIGVTGNQGAVDPTRFENLPGVAEAIRDGPALPGISTRDFRRTRSGDQE